MSTTTTPIDRAAINRRNAQKSTGPRTPEGKSRSRFNAVKHGMSAKTLVLPGEDADVLQQRIEAWTSDLQPQNEVEQFLVERSVQFSWQLERADRAELARLSSLIHGVPAAAASRQQEEAAALGRRLLSGRNVTQEANLQSQLLNALVPGRKSQTVSHSVDVLDHPEAIVLRLESTAAGCRWMLDRWSELRTILDQGQNWQLDEKVKAIRLQGMRPLNCETGEWESHVRIFKELPTPRSIATFEREARRPVGSAGPGGPGRCPVGVPEACGADDRAAGDARRGTSRARRSRGGPASGSPVVRPQQRGRTAAAVPVFVQPVAVSELRHAHQDPTVLFVGERRAGWGVRGN